MIFVGVMVLGLICVGANCRKMLREELDREHFSSIANACRLEFVFVRKEMEEVNTQVEYSWVRTALDYLALTYLLKNAALTGCSHNERLLRLYFKTLSVMVSARHLLKLNEKRAVLKLTAILHYFASRLGERVARVQFSDLAA